MHIAIQKESEIPAYLQLYKQLREDIIKGIYPPYTKLPSKRTMADESGVSIITVEHAYALLCEEGYVESRQRSGYFVIFRTEDTYLTSAPYETRRILPDNGQTESEETFPLSVLMKTMRAVMSSRTILERSPNEGCTALQEAIRKYLLRSRGIHADTEQILIGSGSEYLYRLIVELLGRDKLYAIESPSYHKIEQVYRTADVNIQKLPLCLDGIDSAALRACSADVLHISPYRSFPSGVTASASKRHEYLRWAGEQNRIIVEDDFESEFSVSTKPEETLFSHSPDDNIVYMNSFSKTISPALRTGYMVLPKPLAARYRSRLHFMSCTVPTYIQYVIADLIDSGDFERHINRVRRNKRKQLKLNEIK